MFMGVTNNVSYRSGVRFNMNLKIMAAAVLVAGTGIMPAPRSAMAQMLQCDNRTLQRQDEQRLVASARALLPGDIEPFVAHPCRNSDRASAGIITAHVRNGAGVLQWWELACHRDAEQWMCDTPLFRQFINTPLLIGAKPRRVALTFGKDLTLPRAVELSSRALTAFSDPAVQLPSCSSGVLDSRWAALRARHRLPAGKKPLHVSVSVDGGTNSVTLDDVPIDIQFPTGPGMASGSAAGCWNEWVIVT
jgi:hypothetical protein